MDPLLELTLCKDCVHRVDRGSHGLLAFCVPDFVLAWSGLPCEANDDPSKL